MRKVLTNVGINRQSQKTSFNENSSRSHCVHMLEIAYLGNDPNIKNGVIYIADLAGSERTEMLD